MTKIYMLTTGIHEVEEMEFFATRAGAEARKKQHRAEQEEKAQAYVTQYNRAAPYWMSRDNWDIEEHELRD